MTLAKWTFKQPPEEMEEERLRDELADILFDSDDEIDLEALDRVLDVLDEKDPLPEDWPSTEESLAAFHRKYDYPFKELQNKVDQQLNRGEGR